MSEAPRAAVEDAQSERDESDVTAAFEVKRNTLRVPALDVTPRFVVVAGEQIGRKYVVIDGMTLGRAANASICLNDNSVSRLHFKIHKQENGKYELRDLGSRNGTAINGIVAERHVLEFGDRVEVGTSTVLLFTHYDPLEAQVLLKERMEILGRLGVGIAHDFNNLIGAASANLEFLSELSQTETLGSTEVASAMSDMRIALDRAAELSRRLLKMAREDQEGYVDVSELCSETLQILRRTMHQSIQVECETEPELSVYGNRGILNQMLTNLCINACDAMPQGGSLKVRVQQVPAREMRHVGVQTRVDYVMVTITDTGVGMDEETRRRAFEAFFTTKPEGQGTGLGLNSVWDAVRYHGGTVRFESEVGVGTVFFVYLPLAGGAAKSSDDQARPSDRAPMRAVKSATVMVADDEMTVRRSLSRILIKAGYDVIQAVDGREALLLYEQHRPELVLLDLDMPNLSGAQTLPLLRKIQPDVRVLLISGRWEELSSYVSDTVFGYLQKPFSSDRLRQVVAEALRDSSSDSASLRDSGPDVR